MQPGSIAVDEATGAAAPDERRVLILTLFRLCRAGEPDDAVLERLVAEVRCAELACGEGQAPDDRERLRRRILLSARAVHDFLAANA